MKRTISVSTRLRPSAWLAGSSAAALALPLIAIASPAGAQVASPAPAAAAESDTRYDDNREITVTGSRLRTGFTAPTPVTAIGDAQIESRALNTVAELNYEIPQLRINQNIGRSSEPVGQNVADLRALGSARTLLLLDGRRLAATSPFGGIDTNIFPVSLINGVEVVTGGASAAYGSDAVAGVINFSIDKNFEGLKVDASYGQSKYDDFHRPVISAAAGKSFLDDRLHVTVAGDFFRNTGQTRVASRPWGRRNSVLFNNLGYTPTNGQTKNFIADGATFSRMTFGGLIVAPATSPLYGIQFGPNGTPQPFVYGNRINTVFQLGGQGDSIEDEGNIMPRITRYSGYGRLSYEASDSLSFWSELLWSRVEVQSDLAPNYDSGTLTIRRDNAFLPTSIRDIMTANNIPSFSFGRMNLEDGFSENNSVTRAMRYAAGAEGKFGDGWSWDAFVQRSDNRFRQESVNNRIQANWFAGVDSVISPLTGQPVCRINADASTANDNPACVPINVFGVGSISQAALDWYRGTSFYAAKMRQNAAGLNVAGTPFATWAGDVSLAFGGEYRRETINSVSDAVSLVSGWRSINQQPFSGKLNVKEVYAEVGVPLAKDARFAKSLELNGAIRYADYSSSGGVTTWKVGLNYSPISDIRFRGTLSRDIRAANINELFSGRNQVINTIVDPRDNVANFVTQLTGGNPALDPEKADTKAVGVVLQPGFVPGLSVSLDYYSIKIKDAITSVPAQTIVDNCLKLGIDSFCPFVELDGAGKISRVTATLINTQTVKTSGVDFEAAYRRPVEWFGQSDGTIGARLLVTYVHDLKLTTSGVTIDYVGDLATDYSGQPRWKANFDLTYAGGPLKLGAYVRYIGSGKFRSFYIDDVDLPADQNHVKGRAYVDLSAAYKITDAIELYGKIDNLFNNAPPIIPNNIVQPTVSNSQMFDKIGRFYVAGVRLKL
ncbi:TonB-dependent receptor [Sphingomonas histidinilytica]|uniref:TonB-dependent Receptor Plug Domain n=1 Tax=Rhizorhabdus histidinilytica TaxID=439228 RepID=A0A1T5G1W0_9SPHN|nr:TonB-dependent receptor [Rhizorhabdus histidinilytica]MBO9378386.1 TonB-dependent receptor [Rhizorhabdus histidinilytica]SKC02453.1 TonB-dependent Receptor Plug Domain [Rhizorhabdus histidinilytica]